MISNLGSRGVIYALANNNELMWRRHNGDADGSYKWTGQEKVGDGWVFKSLFTEEPGS
jgi:hypothetical protein